MMDFDEIKILVWAVKIKKSVGKSRAQSHPESHPPRIPPQTDPNQAEPYKGSEPPLARCTVKKLFMGGPPGDSRARAMRVF